MPINKYLNQLAKRYASGISKEHSYRGDLEQLIMELTNGIEVTNEPANVTEAGNPDYVITKNKVPTGYIEAKDIGKDLDSSSYREQFDRYKKALDNLIITDYIKFHFYKQGELIHAIEIARIEGRVIKPLPQNFEEFKVLIEEFSGFEGQTIKSPRRLAEMMASKARLLEDILEKAIISDEVTHDNSSIRDQYDSFKKILINDLTPKEFADIYAQTLAYGMFAARLHDTSLEEFNRHEAAELIPKSNPFLRKLFQYVAGYDIDVRIKTTVDNLADVFRATDVSAILQNFGRSTSTTDPIIHFYETFLSVYDPDSRKARGVYYTPEPVVNFIVRAVDDVLKNEFHLSSGLADNSKIKIKREMSGVAQTKGRHKGEAIIEEVEVHKVQILDPATGTGTFLAEVIKNVYNNNFLSIQGAWGPYVEEHLIPRINGFELLMAPYSIAHLKLDMLLTETGYRPTTDQRFNVYLTNTLEEHHPDTGTIFANWLSNEANEANHIKRDTPVMAILGNPPYSISSSNKGDWIQNLIADYKKNLGERKLNLNDDYIKFIRYAEHLIERNGEGVVAYISNNSFIDGITHRQMRKHLISTFDKIYVLDLHGNSTKQEKAPDGTKDDNVFDIQQGVSINIFIKKKDATQKQIFHADLFGLRREKYKFLLNNSLDSIEWNEVQPDDKNCFFTKKDFLTNSDYLSFVSTQELFNLMNSGIQTKRDSVNIHFDKESAQKVKQDFLTLSIDEIREKYNLPQDGRDWKIDLAVKDLKINDGKIFKEQYRPFDYRYSIYTGNSKGIVAYPREKVSKHIIGKDNFSICLMRQFFQDAIFSHALISKHMVDERTMYSNRGGTYVAPLYLYLDESDDDQETLELGSVRVPNLNMDIVNRFSESLKLTFTFEKEDSVTTFAPIDILDYVYAILHSSQYREKYNEFLKVDFPRIPIPNDLEYFLGLVNLGKSMREIHLLEFANDFSSNNAYPNRGSNVITRSIVRTDFEITSPEENKGRIWINENQYFDNIDVDSWDTYVGGYQPAQKWLKDRRGKILSYEEILHYQKILFALSETNRISNSIDEIVVF